MTAGGVSQTKKVPLPVPITNQRDESDEESTNPMALKMKEMLSLLDLAMQPAPKTSKRAEAGAKLKMMIQQVVATMLKSEGQPVASDHEMT